MPAPRVKTRNFPRRNGVDSSRSVYPLFLACISANLGGLLVGLHLSVFSGILETAAFENAMQPTSLDARIKSQITSALIVGMLMGAVPAGPLCDKAGRRPTLFLTAITFSIATAFMARAHTVAEIIIGRLLAGIGYAIANTVCPIYSAELSPPSLRGIIVNLYQLFITAGIVIAQLSNWAFWNDTQWNTSLLVALVPALGMVCAVYMLVPESPTWLQAKGRPNEAIAASHRLFLQPVEETNADIEDMNGKTEEEKSGFRDMIMDANARKRLFIGAGLGAAQQFTGINAVIFFGPALVSDVLKLEGSSAPFKAAAIVGFGNFVAGFASMGFIERYGRRQLLLSAGAPMIASLVSLGSMKNGWIGRSGFVGIGALLTFICSFAITYGPLTFVICSEVFPMKYRGVAMSVCSMIVGFCALVIAAGFLPMLEWIGGGVYFLYASCVALSSLFIYYFVPETRNLTLKDIDDLLNK